MSPAATIQRYAHLLSRCQDYGTSDTPVPSADVHRLGLQCWSAVGVAGSRRIKELGVGFFFPVQSAEYHFPYR